MTVTKDRAAKDTQLLLNKSLIEYTDEVKKIEQEIQNEPLKVDLWMKKGLELSK